MFLFPFYWFEFWVKYSAAGVRETCFNFTRLSFPSTFYEEGEALQKDFGRVFAFSSSALETLENDSLGREETQVQHSPLWQALWFSYSKVSIHVALLYWNLTCLSEKIRVYLFLIYIKVFDNLNSLQINCECILTSSF